MTCKRKASFKTSAAKEEEERTLVCVSLECVSRNQGRGDSLIHCTDFVKEGP